MKITKIIKSEIQEFRWRDNRIATALSLLSISTTIGPMPNTALLYYTALVLVFLYSLTKSKGINGLCVWFAGAGAASILLNDTPSFFTAPTRFAFFMLVFVIASPLLENDNLRTMRHQTLLNMSKMCALVGVVSFFCYYLGINYMRSYFYDSSDFISQVGLFGGITKHSMLLGPMSGIGAVYCGYKALANKEKWYWIPTAMCMACSMFAASRAAFLASLAGIIATIYSFAASKTQFLKLIARISFVALISFPIWNDAMSGIEQKNQGNINAGSATNSRDSKWNNRIEEFQDSPLYGIGFATVDLKYTSDYSDSGGVESGTSWLTILSTMGLFGFIPFVLLMCKAYCNTFLHRTHESALLSGLLIFLMFHMIAEGYIIYAGNAFCIIAWLIIGASVDNKFR